MQGDISISYCTHARVCVLDRCSSNPTFPRSIMLIIAWVVYYSSSLSSTSITRSEPLTVLRCMHICSALKQCKIIDRPVSLLVVIEYIGTCYNLHYYPQMGQFDWSEMTYYNITSVTSNDQHLLLTTQIHNIRQYSYNKHHQQHVHVCNSLFLNTPSSMSALSSLSTNHWECSCCPRLPPLLPLGAGDRWEDQLGDMRSGILFQQAMG